MKKELANTDPLISLKEFTAARIAIGRVGNSIPLKQSLEFKLAHAHARDAIYSVLDTEKLFAELKVFNLPILHLHSKAQTRHKYLKRPDHGRQLNEESEDSLKDYKNGYDIAIIIADGLSATAVNENAFALLQLIDTHVIRCEIKTCPVVPCRAGQGSHRR